MYMHTYTIEKKGGKILPVCKVLEKVSLEKKTDYGISSPPPDSTHVHVYVLYHIHNIYIYIHVHGYTCIILVHGSILTPHHHYCHHHCRYHLLIITITPSPVFPLATGPFTASPLNNVVA